MLPTKRLNIRFFLKSDYQDIYEYLSLPEIYRFERGEPVTLKIARDFAREWSKGANFWAAELETTHKVIGQVSFFPERPPEFRTWQIGYIFNPAFHNKGYASEAARAVIKYAFTELNAHRIVAHCSPENTASWKVLENCGMRKEALNLKDFLHHTDENGEPVWFDSYQYAILDEELT